MKEESRECEDAMLADRMVAEKTAQANYECGKRDKSLDFLSGDKYKVILVPDGVWLFVSKDEKIDLSDRIERTRL